MISRKNASISKFIIHKVGNKFNDTKNAFSEKIVDFESMILETQKRVWGALKQGYEYVGITDDSEKFLRKNVFAKFDMIALYVDLVGSTTMTLELPEEKLAIIISSFAQEMASVITLHGGYVLKFVGDQHQAACHLND